MKRPYYRTCPQCGNNLDPNEICECVIKSKLKSDDKDANYKSVQGGEDRNVQKNCK